MKDEVVNILKNKTHGLTNYLNSIGQNKGKITLPNKKQYLYPTYFWTVPFAKHLFCKNFKLLKEEKIDTNQYILIFVNKKTAI